MPLRAGELREAINMSKITFGRYVPSDSFADKCDPRGKLLLLIAYITAVFLAKNFYGLAVVAAMLIVFMAAAKASPLKVLAAVKGVLFLLLFTVIINLFSIRAASRFSAGGLSESRKRGCTPRCFWRRGWCFSSADLRCLP